METERYYEILTFHAALLLLNNKIWQILLMSQLSTALHIKEVETTISNEDIENIVQGYIMNT